MSRREHRVLLDVCLKTVRNVKGTVIVALVQRRRHDALQCYRMVTERERERERESESERERKGRMDRKRGGRGVR